MCDWNVNLRCRHCRSSQRLREPIRPEREVSPRPLCHSCRELREDVQRLQRQVESLRNENRDLRERRIIATGGGGRRLYAGDGLHEHVITVGKITLEEVDIEGKFVKVKNTSNQDRSLHGWTIGIQYDNEPPSTYRFPEHFRIHAGQTVTIWAGATCASQRSPDDLVWRERNSWGTDKDIRMTLLSHFGEEMARRTLVHGVLGCRRNDDNFP